METLKIKIPKGFEVDSFDKKTGEIKLKEIPKDIKERVKTFTDVLKYKKINATDFAHQCSGLTDDETAYKKIKLIASVLNETWTPDWDNSNEYKYEPWFKMGSSGFRCDGYDDWGTYSVVGSRLCFKSRELAKYAGETFTDIYKEFMIIKLRP